MKSLWRNDRFEVFMPRAEFVGWLLVAFFFGGVFLFAIAALSVALRGAH